MENDSRLRKDEAARRRRNKVWLWIGVIILVLILLFWIFDIGTFLGPNQ